MLLKGRVIFSSGGNYRVLANSNVFTAKPRGYFRNEGIKILVGDIVKLKVEKTEAEINSIEKLYERKNEFIRPNISNIDHAIIVASLVEPKLDTLLIDKFTTIFQTFGIEPIIIFTKYDLMTEDIKTTVMERVDEYKDSGYKILVKHIDDLNILEEWTKNKFSVITGQTGVGKSTLLNSIKKDLELETQEISKHLGRGKHTTRHSEAFEIFKGTYFVDTPGFSALQLNELTTKDASKNFFNFKEISKRCKFNDCKHINEMECAVLSSGISKEKLYNYKKIISGIEEGKEKY